MMLAPLCLSTALKRRSPEKWIKFGKQLEAVEKALKEALDADGKSDDTFVWDARVFADQVEKAREVAERKVYGTSVRGDP